MSRTRAAWSASGWRPSTDLAEGRADEPTIAIRLPIG